MGPSHFIILIGFTDPAKSEIQGRQNPLVRTDSSHTEIFKLLVATLQFIHKKRIGLLNPRIMEFSIRIFSLKIVSKNVLCLDIPGQGTYI